MMKHLVWTNFIEYIQGKNLHSLLILLLKFSFSCILSELFLVLAKSNAILGCQLDDHHMNAP